MYAETLREAGYAAYRSRLNALLGIPENASELQIHDRIVDGFPAGRWHGAGHPVVYLAESPASAMLEALRLDQRLFKRPSAS